MMTEDADSNANRKFEAWGQVYQKTSWEPKGLPATDWIVIRTHHEELLSRVQQTLDLHSSDFNQIMLPVMDAFIKYCHLLPASENHHHAEPGGLIRHSLEVTLHAMRRSEAFLYGREKTPGLQSTLDVRWRVAIALGALLHDIGKAVTDMTIIAKVNDVDLEWNPFLTGLWDWLQEHKIERYYLCWRPRRYGRHEIASTFTTRNLLPANCIDFLGCFGSEIPTALFESLAGVNQEERFGNLIKEADRDSVSRDLRGHPLTLDTSRGQPMEKIVLTLLRRPILRGEWTLNNNDCCFWSIDGDLYIDWFLGMQVIRRGIEEDGIRTLSDREEDIADILIERGIAIPPHTSGKKQERYHFIEIRPEKALYRFLRLSTLDAISPDGTIPACFHVHETKRVIDSRSAPEIITAAPIVQEATTTGTVVWETSLDLSWIPRMFSLSGPCAAAMLDHRIWMPYPLLFEMLEQNPIETLKILDSRSLLERDPDMNLKLVWELGGQRGVVLTQTFSNELVIHFGHPVGLPPSENKSAKLSEIEVAQKESRRNQMPENASNLSGAKKSTRVTTQAKIINSREEDLLNVSRLDAIRNSYR